MNIQTAISGELWAAIRRSYESEAWANAILDGIHHLSDAIRLKTGLQSDGTALAGQALGAQRLKAGDVKVKNALDSAWFSTWSWGEYLQKELDRFVRTEPVNEEEDDIPF